jgi:hypothetical protein
MAIVIPPPIARTSFHNTHGAFKKKNSPQDSSMVVKTSIGWVSFFQDSYWIQKNLMISKMIWFFVTIIYLFFERQGRVSIFYFFTKPTLKMPIFINFILIDYP